ncbi:NlpC/P60 family protein [Streptomyces avermitilis]|uniref:C40 family peptidase n=1 Tax=Streptomyces avermitilis TaxID=33903 RepID=UPI0033BAF92A
MSGRLLRLVCTAAMTAGALLSPGPAAAAPPPDPDSTATAPDTTETATDTTETAPDAAEAVPDTTEATPEPSATVPGSTGPDASDAPSMASLLTELQRLYRQAEQATEIHNATTEKLKRQQTEVARLDRQLTQARLSLQESHGAVGRLARQQYQGSTSISPYVRLLLARDPQHALEEGHVIGQLAQARAKSVARLTGSERSSDRLAREARAALDRQLTLAERQKKERDDVQGRLDQVEARLAALSTNQRAELVEFEKNGEARAQQRFLASGSLSSARIPSRQGDKALRYAVQQLGKPYEWGAEGPKSYDCSGLTSQAWAHAGRAIPRTSQGQWAALPHVPLKQLRPGDLVIYFPEATHVALYLGNGMVVQAPRPGGQVKVSPIAANPVLGAVRPDPRAKPLRHYAPLTLPGTAAKEPALPEAPTKGRGGPKGHGAVPHVVPPRGPARPQPARARV